MSVNRGLIQNDKYFTQFGQLRKMSRTNMGDLIQTSVVTAPCLVYLEDQGETQTAPAVGTKTQHRATISNTFAVAEGDHLSAVTDKFGRVVIADSRIVKITDYNSWRHGSRFLKLDLDLDLT